MSAIASNFIVDEDWVSGAPIRFTSKSLPIDSVLTHSEPQKAAEVQRLFENPKASLAEALVRNESLARRLAKAEAALRAELKKAKDEKEKAAEPNANSIACEICGYHKFVRVGHRAEKRRLIRRDVRAALLLDCGRCGARAEYEPGTVKTTMGHDNYNAVYVAEWIA